MVVLMKGVILAGGEGTRLKPLTRVTNKHLLPVYNKPMIYYPLEFLMKLGITDIVLIVGKESAGDFANLLGDGSEFGVTLTYKVQSGSLGISHAIYLAKDIVGNNPLTVILGDNVFAVDERELDRLKKLTAEFAERPNGAALILKEVDDPERFGTPVFDTSGKLIRIDEKPAKASTKLAVTGLYFYDGTVFDKISRLKPSARNELEVTDLNNAYLNEGKLNYHILEGEWSDAGTFESLFKANSIARKIAKSQEKK